MPSAQGITRTVVDDIDKVRKAIGLPKLEDAARAKKKENGRQEPTYVDADKIMEAVRSISKGNSAIDEKPQDGSSGPG